MLTSGDFDSRHCATLSARGLIARWNLYWYLRFDSSRLGAAARESEQCLVERGSRRLSSRGISRGPVKSDSSPSVALLGWLDIGFRWSVNRASLKPTCCRECDEGRLPPLSTLSTDDARRLTFYDHVAQQTTELARTTRSSWVSSCNHWQL